MCTEPLYLQIKAILYDLDPEDAQWHDPRGENDEYDNTAFNLFQVLLNNPVETAEAAEESILEILGKYDEDVRAERKEIGLQFYKKAAKEAAGKILKLLTAAASLDIKMQINDQEKALEAEVNSLMAQMQSTETVQETLAAHDIPMLVKIAAELIEAQRNWAHLGVRQKRYDYPKHKLKGMLHAVLNERRKRMNAGFRWTDEARARLFGVSEKLLKVCIAGQKEALEAAENLHKRMTNNDSFAKDFCVEAVLNACPLIEGERKHAASVESFLAENTMPVERVFRYTAAHSSNGATPADVMPDYAEFVNREYNFNSIECLNGEAKNGCVHKAVESMINDFAWSIQDVLSIERVYIDVKTECQYYD
jgi:hypothetical protein